MNTSIFSYYRCPVCGSALQLKNRSLYCEKAEKPHCFDLSSSGYVNLNAPGKASNAHTGDDKEMIRSRNAFLSLGLYDAISDTCAELMEKTISENDSFFFADAGCGEGYHTCRIAKHLSKKTRKSVFAFGFDASKTGVEQGAKRSRTILDEASNLQVAFAAANLFALPLADHSLDAVVSLFAPIAEKENARLLKKDGVLVVGASGKKHLWELRELLYDIPREPSGTIKSPEGFRQIESFQLTYQTTVPSSASLAQLFRMTPFSYKTSRDALERIQATPSLPITIDVNFEIFQPI